MEDRLGRVFSRAGGSALVRASLALVAASPACGSSGKVAPPDASSSSGATSGASGAVSANGGGSGVSSGGAGVTSGSGGTQAGAAPSTGGASGTTSGGSGTTSGGAAGSIHTGGTGARNTGGTSGGGTSSGGSGGAMPDSGATGSPTIRVVGRTDGNAAPSFEWSGVSIQAHFKGTAVTADMDGGNENYFEVIVDGQEQPRVSTSSGRKTIPIVSGLSDAEHDIVIWRRTEADDYAPTQFFGLDFGGGTLLPGSAPLHKLEVIGDSITCGYGDEGQGPNCSFSFDTENDYLAYGSVAARQLDADLYTECWSGKGMYRNGGGDMTDTIPVIYPRAIPTDASSQWNFSWVPDAVIINLGTNDFSTGDPGQPFTNAYEGFVSTLRTHYPNAYIFLVIGPMLTGDSLTEAQSDLDSVVQARKGAGDTRIQQILIDAQDGSDGYGCDYHPTVKTQNSMGAAIASAMKPVLGW